ncbi:hypothetical protein J6590_034403 [Homalodisca vitripennis]|nr:hypothetical protein J6590_034403 [Homalodisca vitripennis]
MICHGRFKICQMPITNVTTLYSAKVTTTYKPQFESSLKGGKSGRSTVADFKGLLPGRVQRSAGRIVGNARRYGPAVARQSSAIKSSDLEACQAVIPPTPDPAELIMNTRHLLAPGRSLCSYVQIWHDMKTDWRSITYFLSYRLSCLSRF